MEATKPQVLTVETTIKGSIEKVWKLWTEPEHIKNWCNASDDWHVPAAENDIRVGGNFKTAMAAKDGSFAFGFKGVYTAVERYRNIAYTLTDGRKVNIILTDMGDTVKLTESFEAENTNSLELQQQGWQAIVNNFKNYVERLK